MYELLGLGLLGPYRGIKRNAKGDRKLPFWFEASVGVAAGRKVPLPLIIVIMILLILILLLLLLL